jgi:hypothetical protein
MISGKGFPAAAGEDAVRVAGPLGSDGPGRQAAPCLAGSASGAASGVPSPSHTLRTGAKRRGKKVKRTSSIQKSSGTSMGVGAGPECAEDEPTNTIQGLLSTCCLIHRERVSARSSNCPVRPCPAADVIFLQYQLITLAQGVRVSPVEK